MKISIISHSLLFWPLRGSGIWPKCQVVFFRRVCVCASLETLVHLMQACLCSVQTHVSFLGAVEIDRGSIHHLSHSLQRDRTLPGNNDTHFGVVFCRRVGRDVMGEYGILHTFLL